MSTGVRVDGEQVAEITARLRTFVAAWREQRPAPSMPGVAPGAREVAEAAATAWRRELEAASSGLGEVARSIDESVGVLAATDATLAESARGIPGGRGPARAV